MTRKPRPILSLNKDPKQTGRDSEKRVSKRLSASLKPASGALVGAKGDMATPEYTIEAKATQNLSLSLPLDWWLGVHIAAREQNREPALTLTFVTANGRPRKNGRLVVISEDHFKELTGG